MGDLLLNWLNDEIQLSRRVTNFQEDFHNGFLFGQLLAKYSQQLNFHQFIDKDDKASRVNNFSLLMETFTALRVTYDANVALKIVNRHLGVAKKLLYELKTQLEKTSDNAFSRSAKLGKTLTPLKKIQISRDKFDQVQREHFVKQLNELHPAQKEIVEHKLLKKFSDFHLLASRRAAQEEEKERQAKLLLRSKFYEHERDNLKKSEEFRKQWEAENRDKWANNMTVRQIQISKDTQFRQKEQDQRTRAQANSEANALRSLESDIAAFEKRNPRSRNAADSDSEGQVEPIAGVSAVKPKAAQTRLAQGRQQRRLAGGENEKKKHQREKRRRKMIVQQAKKYQLIEITRRERCVLATIEQTSKQEKEIQYQIWRAWQNKNIIIENQALQAEKIREKEETREINARFKREELLKTYREEHKKEVGEALQGLTQLGRVHQARMRKTVYAECERMVVQLLDITEKMYVSAQERNSPLLDPAELQAEFVKFVTGTPDAEEGSLSVQHYVEGSHEWNIPVVRPEQDVSANPKEDNALPNETVNNYFLGNILKTVFEKMYQQPAQEEKEAASDRLVIALLGLEFSRKHQLAAALAEKYQFQVVEVERLAQQKLNDWLQLQKQGVECSKETSEIARQCFAGQPLEERLVVGLVAEALRGCKRAVLLDFPNTYDQAIELCRLTSGVQPHDLLEQDRLAKKIQEFSRLARPSEARIVARQVRGCGLDFVWWIDLSPNNCFDRMLGRRWIGKDIVSIYDDVDPDLLKEGEKASALAMRSQFKLSNKEKLMNWFSLFGMPTAQGSKNCWEAIDGNIEKDQLLGKVIEKAEEAVKLKEEERLAAVKAQQQRKKEKQLQEQRKKEKDALKQRCSKSNPEVLKQQLGAALGKAELDRVFLQQVSDVWNRIEATSLSSFRRVFESLASQQKARRSYLAQVKRNFIALLTRQDHKFHLIKDFQRGYNEFLANNEDMLPMDHTKEELHQRVEDLENDLLGLVEQKRQDAIAERSSIMGSGWLQAQVDLVYECLSLLVQAELNRFAVSEKIIVDFYAKRFMCNTKLFEPLSPELNMEVLAALEGWKDGQCPRLDKLVSQALRILNREEEVVEDKNKKGGKGAPPKKDEKKAAKKGGKEQVEEVKEPTQEQLELKAAVNTQKAILRQRLNRIRTLGQRVLAETSSSASKLYTDLQDLYVYAHKVEQKAVSGLCRIFRRSIEQEQKIEFEVQIKHVEVLQTQHVRNFEKAQPIIQPAREQASDQHFTLSNLQQVFRFVGNEAQGTRISTRRLTVLLTRLITSEHLRKLTPKSWKSLTPSNIESFVRLLDRSNAGYVALAELFMFLTMSGYTVPTVAEIEEYTLQLSNYSSLKQASLEKFITTRSWFDQQLTTRENTRVFDRNREVKRALFGIFRTDDNTVQISSFLSAVTLQQVGVQVRRGEERYFDVAFG